MEILGFAWLADIVDKLEQKHGVKQQEVVELFTNRPHIRFVEKGHRLDENFTRRLDRLIRVAI